MRRFTALLAGVICWAGLLPSARAQQDATASITDSRLRAATEFVLQSDRYLHQSRLRRGMTGYGLTVMAGTEIVRFEVEIVSVMEKFFPQRDMILARCSGQGLEESGIVAGMSGSPVYIVDPADGKSKLIGAVAYGWSFSKQPIAGIQPISQMLAVSAISLDGKDEPRSPAAGSAGAAPGAGGEDARASLRWLDAALDPEKRDFARFGWPERFLRGAAPASQTPQVRPIVTPLMTGGLSDRSRACLAEALSGMDMVPVQSGSAGVAASEELRDLKLEPGSAVCVPLVTGDQDMSAVGTVTEVLGDRVLGFGHPMFGNGDVSFPMATGYIHAVLPSVSRSMKLSSHVRVVGELTADEATAIGGVVGHSVDMIPLSVEVVWPSEQKQTYHYQLLRDRFFTALLANVVASDSVWGTRNLPREHTVEYTVAVDFGALGRYQVSNFNSDRDIAAMLSDLTRTLAVMANNPFGQARVEGMTVKVHIGEGSRRASVLGGRLDRNAYAPGQTITATVDLQPYQGRRTTRTVQVHLPENLPEGRYVLKLGDTGVATELLRHRHPNTLDPRDLKQLLDSLQRLTEPRANCLYAVLESGNAGLAVGRHELADVPPTVAAALQASAPLDVARRGEAVSVCLPLDFELKGRADLPVVVMKHPPQP